MPKPGTAAAQAVVLRAGDVALVLAVEPPDASGRRPLPAVAHWGADLGAVVDADALLAATAVPVPPSAYDEPVRRRVVPMPADGWRGRPGLRGVFEDGTGWSPDLRLVDLASDEHSVRVTAADEGLGLVVVASFVLHPAGVLEHALSLRNDGSQAYHLLELSPTLPIADRLEEVLEPTGRHCFERAPQRLPLGFGSRLRESRHGPRPGHDAPLVLAVGTAGFGWRHGEVLGVHLAWSGDALHWCERHPDNSSSIGAGALLAPGEVTLAPGETYEAPAVLAAFSGAGLDGIGAAFNAYLRARPSHPRRPRPVVLNTWEAVYFDHRLDTLTALADVAAEVGVERFVLDDGWFRGRRDDSAGLGDWYVDADVWPEGLGPLITHVRQAGMEFGLWVEPEMVNPDSDVYREHPDWVLGPAGRQALPWRRQQVLDLSNDAVYAYLLERLHALLTENDIAFLKWDQNRDLLESVAGDGRAGVDRQVRRLYALLDELRARHSDVEIESCASGGARADAGILARTDRIWTSDSNDPLDRQQIQRWTSLLVPLELMGAHVGPPTAHTTGRTTSLAFRGATALFGHFGMEWDITTTAPDERRRLAAMVAAYKEHRALLHSGTLVRAEHHDPAASVHGVVSPEGDEALVAYVQERSSVASVPGQFRLPGLRDDATYVVRVVPAFDDVVMLARTDPAWLPLARDGGLRATGRLLGHVGLSAPAMAPEQALVLHLSVSST
jgi:alpha-galactosidase